MNQSTRTIIFFSSIISMFIYYLIIIPMLPLSFENEVVYANYTFASFFIVVPLVQMLLRQRILKRFEDDFLFEFKIHDASPVQHILYMVFAYLLILRPLTPSIGDFQYVQTIHWLSFIAWMLYAEILIMTSYTRLRAKFGREFIKITGTDFRIDFPFGNALYSHSGIYQYDDFETFHFEGDKLILSLRQNLGKVVVKIPQNLHPQIESFLKAHQIEKPKHYFE